MTAGNDAQALQGGSGVGKTALAVGYAYRHRSEFDTVWWVRAETPPCWWVTTLISRSLSAWTGPARPDHQLMAAVRRWLEDHDRWLLVLDNAEGPDILTGQQSPLTGLVELLPRVVPDRC